MFGAAAASVSAVNVNRLNERVHAVGRCGRPVEKSELAYSNRFMLTMTGI